MRTRVLIALAILSFAACVSAQQPVITAFESDGTLTWSNAYPDAMATIERLTDVPATGSPVTVTETIGTSDGSTTFYNYTVENPPIVNPSVIISDGTHSWNDVTGSSTNPPVLTGAVNYPGGMVYATYSSHVPTAGTPIEVEYSYLPLTITQEWLSVQSEQATSDVAHATVSMSEDISLFRVVNDPAPMALIPGGSNSGTNPLAAGELHDSCYYPATYSLSVASFYMDRYEVTNDEMVRVMQWAYDQGLVSATEATVSNTEGNPQELLNLNAGGCRITWHGGRFEMKAEKASGYPCVNVSWYGAVAYCNYLSGMEERTPCYNLSNWSCNFSANGYRLPTIEEWEYAARGGLVSRRFPWGDTISHSQANYKASDAYNYDLSSGGHHPSYSSGDEPYTSPVGAFPPNAFGLYDMAGNVAELCQDVRPCEDPQIAMRGGSYNGWASYCRTGVGESAWPFSSGPRVGFRAVLPLDQ